MAGFRRYGSKQGALFVINIEKNFIGGFFEIDKFFLNNQSEGKQIVVRLTCRHLVRKAVNHNSM